LALLAPDDFAGDGAALGARARFPGHVHGLRVHGQQARALIGGLKHDLPADDAELRRLVPLKPLTFCRR